MIGIGVAVDYSLFIVSRFRRELHAGAASDEALARALSSSGTAVVFSGATVAVSLAALFAIDVNALRSMAVGAIVVVCISVLASITLLPALLAAAGTRVDRLRAAAPVATSGGRRATPSGAAGRACDAPPAARLRGRRGPDARARRPVPLDADVQPRAATSSRRDAEVRVATERAHELDRTGLRRAGARAYARRPRELARPARAVPGVAHVEPAACAARDGSPVAVDATLAVPVESGEAHDVVQPDRASWPRHDALVGGSTVFDRDVTNAIFGGLWKMLLVILAACYVVLLVLLRSVLLPLKAVLMNLLSVGAAYGVLVAVFQWGWLDWTGYDSPGYVETIVPAARARRHVRALDGLRGVPAHADPRALARARRQRTGRRRGPHQSARIITSAALVMVAVFVAFVVAGVAVAEGARARARRSRSRSTRRSSGSCSFRRRCGSSATGTGGFPPA